MRLFSDWLDAPSTSDWQPPLWGQVCFYIVFVAAIVSFALWVTA